MQRKPEFAFLLAVTAALVLAAATYGLLAYQTRIPATGNIEAVLVDVYGDQACTVKLTSIDWGVLSPGQNKSFTCYVKSQSNVNATLSLSTGNWNPPSAAGYISLGWNREGYKVMPGEAVQSVLNLLVSSGIQGVSSFSFDIVITATEAAG